MTTTPTPEAEQALPLDASTFDCRVDFADELAQLAREDERIVAVCNDSVGSSNLTGFREEFPDRLINVGIAEQDLVGVAAGLANAGLIPFVCAAAPFLTGRATEQIKADVAYSQRHVVLCGQSPGMAYGELGPTHHSIEDLSWMRAIAHLPVVVPAGPRQTRSAVRWAAALGRGSYLRIPRFKVPEVSPEHEAFEPGRAVLLRSGSDVTIVAIGSMVSRALWAADTLAADGIACPGAQPAVRRAAGPNGRDRGGDGDRWDRHGGGGHAQRRSRCCGGLAGQPGTPVSDEDPRGRRLRADGERVVLARPLRSQHRGHHRRRARAGRASWLRT